MIITDLDQLEAIYHTPPAPASTVKDIGRTPEYRALITASPFVALRLGL